MPSGSINQAEEGFPVSSGWKEEPYMGGKKPDETLMKDGSRPQKKEDYFYSQSLFIVWSGDIVIAIFNPDSFLRQLWGPTHLFGSLIIW